MFDTNGDGVLTQSDADFSKFKVEVTLANGTTEVKTLTELGITAINLKADLTSIQYTDGQGATDAVRQKGPVDLFEHRAHSAPRWAGTEITGQTTFTRNVKKQDVIANDNQRHFIRSSHAQTR